MANVQVETKTVRKWETVEEDEYVLTLSEEEARSLYALTGKCASKPGTYGAHVNAIRDALDSAGVKWTLFSQRFKTEADVIIGKPIEN